MRHMMLLLLRRRLLLLLLLLPLRLLLLLMCPVLCSIHRAVRTVVPRRCGCGTVVAGRGARRAVGAVVVDGAVRAVVRVVRLLVLLVRAVVVHVRGAVRPVVVHVALAVGLRAVVVRGALLGSAGHEADRRRSRDGHSGEGASL